MRGGDFDAAADNKTVSEVRKGYVAIIYARSPAPRFVALHGMQTRRGALTAAERELEMRGIYRNPDDLRKPAWFLHDGKVIGCCFAWGEN